MEKPETKRWNTFHKMSRWRSSPKENENEQTESQTGVSTRILSISKLNRNWAESWRFLALKLMLQDDCKWFWKRRRPPDGRTRTWFLFSERIFTQSDPKPQALPISKLRRSWAESGWFLALKPMLQADCKWFWKRRRPPDGRTRIWFPRGRSHSHFLVHLNFQSFRALFSKIQDEFSRKLC